MTTPPPPPPPNTPPTGAVPGPDTNAYYRPDYATGERPRVGINPANEQTTILTPVPERTGALNRIPLAERKRWQVIVASLGVVLLAAIGFSIYLWIASDRWAARADDLETESYDLGARLATEQEYVVQQTEKITILTQQLATAQQRITELADQTAQAGDDVAFAQQRIQLLTELSALGGSVSVTLNRCVNEQKTLVGYLQNADAYTPSDIAAFKSDVDALCAAAQSANATLQKQLAQ